MKIGNPIKLLLKITERRGRFIVTGDTMEISSPSLHTARRLGVVLRKVMDRSNASR